MAVTTVTRHCTICGEDRETPADALGGLEHAPDAVAAAARAAAAASRAGWTPREVVVHLADSEIVFGWRIRQILSEDDPEIAGFDEQRWAGALRYAQRDARRALDAFAAVRASNVELLRNAGEAASSRTYRHGEYGRRTLGELLQHRADHDIQHLRQIEGTG